MTPRAASEGLTCVDGDAPPERLVFMAGKVHVWGAHLSVSPEHLCVLQAMLSAGEAARAAAFHFPRDRQRFIVARGTLRAILARYIGIAASTLQLRYGQYGKPYLDPPLVHFNLAHSGEMAVYAVSPDCRVGVDIEHRECAMPYREIAARFYSASEQQALAALPEPQRIPAFLARWVRKEAYLKGLGIGLSGLSPQLEIPPAGWTLYDVPIAPGYLAALAVEGTSPE